MPRRKYSRALSFAAGPEWPSALTCPRHRRHRTRPISRSSRTSWRRRSAAASSAGAKHSGPDRCAQLFVPHPGPVQSLLSRQPNPSATDPMQPPAPRVTWQRGAHQPHLCLPPAAAAECCHPAAGWRQAGRRAQGGLHGRRAPAEGPQEGPAATSTGWRIRRRCAQCCRRCTAPPLPAAGLCAPNKRHCCARPPTHPGRHRRQQLPSALRQPKGIKGLVGPRLPPGRQAGHFLRHAQRGRVRQGQRVNVRRGQPRLGLPGKHRTLPACGVARRAARGTASSVQHSEQRVQLSRAFFCSLLLPSLRQRCRRPSLEQRSSPGCIAPALVAAGRSPAPPARPPRPAPPRPPLLSTESVPSSCIRICRMAARQPRLGTVARQPGPRMRQTTAMSPVRGGGAATARCASAWSAGCCSFSGSVSPGHSTMPAGRVGPLRPRLRLRCAVPPARPAARGQAASPAGPGQRLGGEL